MSIYDRFEQHIDKTFNDAADRYLDEFRRKDKRRQTYALQPIRYYIGNLRLIDIDDEALAPYKHDRLNGTGPFDKPAMKGTVNKELTVALTVLNKASRIWRWIPAPPRFERVDGDTRSSYPLSWEEQDRLFSSLPSAWDISAGLFATNTGVRKAELFGLKWTDMVPLPDLDTFVFVLRETKNSKDRAVICNSIARRAVSHMKGNGSEYVFPAGMCRQSGKTWANAWIRAGLPKDPLVRKGIHNLRHTFAHRLRACGVRGRPQLSAGA